MRIYLLYPKLKPIQDDLFAGGRKGNRFEANTGYAYLKGNDERGSWFELTVLGFGLGFYWNFKHTEDFV